MINLSLNELKLISKNRGINDYENKSEDDLIKILSEPKTKMSLSKKKIRDIKKDFNELRYKFARSKIKEIRRSLYDIKIPKNLPKSKIKGIEKNLNKLHESLFKLKKYYDNDGIEYMRIKHVKNLFNQTDEDYYKPIKTTCVFDNKNNYIEYKSEGDKDKILSVKEYLDMIRPYLSDMINDHRTQGEWKIQLTLSINFMSSKDSEETRTIHAKSHNVEIMMDSKTDEIIKELFKSLLQKYQEGLEESIRGSEFVFDGVGLLYYHLQKISLKRGGSYIDLLKGKKIKKQQ